MRRVSGLAEMARQAEALRRLASDEPLLTQTAIAAVIHKRALGSLDADCKSSCAAGFPDRCFCRALAIVCQVWCGAYEDPTRGATRFHKHDACPGWARARQPQALIGGWLFY